MHRLMLVSIAGCLLACTAALGDPNAWLTRTSGGTTGGDDQYINGVRVATFGSQTSLTNASQFGTSGLDLFSGPLIVNSPNAYGWQQTGSTLIVNHNQTADIGCVDGSWGLNFAGRGLYPSADQVAICDNVSAATPVAVVTQPNFSFNNSSTTGYADERIC